MSRIYEALQKAEIEQAPENPAEAPAEQNGHSQPGQVQRLAEQYAPLPTIAELPDPSALEFFPTQIPNQFQPAPQASSQIQPHSQPQAPPRFASVGPETAPDSRDLNAIPRRPWSPTLAKLPALLERGAEVEQFRSLRSRIFELRDAGPLKSILISSGLPQEGKSFIAANLAISLARHKSSKVLLIDGDMRRYTLHQVLGCEAHPGLADYLSGQATMFEIMQRPEQPPPNSPLHSVLPPNLTFIPGGDGGDKAADLSGNPRFSELIQTVSPFFDWIVVDSSPVLPVSDAVNLARACDGVLLVARSGITKYPVAQKAQAELKASKILGFVLNAVQHATQTTDYYGYDEKD